MTLVTALLCLPFSRSLVAMYIRDLFLHVTELTTVNLNWMS